MSAIAASTGRRPGFIQGLMLLLPITMAVMGVSLLITVVPLMYEHFKDVPHFDYLIQGGVMTMPAIWVVLFSPVAGWLADRFGRRSILIAAMIVYAGIGIAPAFLDNLYAIILTRVGVGICESVVMTVSTTMICDYFSGKSRERWLAGQTATASLSALAIIPLGGVLAANYGWHGPFYIYIYSLLLVVGAGAGILGGYEYAVAHTANVSARTQALAPKPAIPAAAEITNISSIVRQPNSEIVEVRYNQVVPQQMEGSLDDPKIRELLMVASEDSTSSDVRDDSVGLLAAECRAGHSCQAAGIRDALMVVLRYDKNAGVRLKALDGLGNYVAADTRVRDAVLEALLNDTDPRIRTEAVNILEPVEADTSVRQVLHSVANSDQNRNIRTVSREVLSRVPEIQ